MKRTFTVLALTVGFSAVAAAAQDRPPARLAERLSPELTAQIQLRIEAARSQALPDQSVALLALEGVAKGRSAEEVLGAVDALLEEMGRARGALAAGGRTPVGGEVEAATAAIRMGVEAAQVSALAQTGPSGRDLAVPLMVMGGLAQRGLPSDQALKVVQDRMAAGAGDADLLGDLRGASQGSGHGMGMRPGQAGAAIGLGGASRVNPAGILIPLGPPVDRLPPGRRPGGGS